MGIDSAEIEERISGALLEEIREKTRSKRGKGMFFALSLGSDGRAEVLVDFCPEKDFEGLSDCDVVVHSHFSGDLEPVELDSAAASVCAENGQGFYIIDRGATRIFALLDCTRSAKIEKLSVENTAFYLSSDGPLSKIFGGYEERPSQIALLRGICGVFNEDRIGVFEAGTGVGKSFAYLIPAMLWAEKNRERVVISTGTKNLQQQIFEKDIPLAKKIIGKEVSAVLVKGRANFVCLRRLSEVANSPDIFSDDKEILDKIYAWSRKTKDGSRSDLSFQPPESVWQRVNSEADACMGSRCPHRKKCFVMKMKKDAGDADILVVNHHLLFADVQSRIEGAGFQSSAVLPQYSRLIFDEAHGIEDSATSFFSGSLTRFKIQKQTNLLFRRRRGSVSGLLFTISALSDCEDRTAEIELEIESAREIFSELEKAADSFVAGNFSERLRESNGRASEKIVGEFLKLKKSLGLIAASVRAILDGIDDADRDEGAVWDTKAVLRRLDSFVEICQNYAGWVEHPELVFWVQRNRLPHSMVGEGENPFYFTFYQTPLDISPFMDTGVFEPMKSVVCVSATLGIEGRFDFWEKRMGLDSLDRARLSVGQFDSPFPYASNMVLAVPSDAPFPDNPNFQAFVEKAVSSLVLNAGGRTLVLFTSYDMLRKTFEAVGKILPKKSKIRLMKQGDDDSFRLLSIFKDDESSVLFATDSFWEGVDVPGRSLSQVVIVKLPFSVPSDPVFSARSEILEKNGGNPFMELSVPEAVIRFRQGFGRLIRRGDDRGAVVVLDRRIIEKRYGSTFTRSVPNTPRVYESLDGLLKKIRGFVV